MKLTENIYLVGGGEVEYVMTDQMDCNVYMMRVGDFYVLIDSGGGMAADTIVNNIQGHGVDPKDIQWLLLTHAHGDHAAGAAPLKERLSNLRVAIAAEAAEWLRTGDEKSINLDKGRATGMYPSGFRFLPCGVDVELHDGQKLELDRTTFEVIATPGHCAGHVSYLVHDEGKSILFAGDAIFPQGKILLQYINDCDLHQSLQSVERLAKLRPDHLFSGHRQPILNSAVDHFKLATDRIETLVVPWNLF
tara:strand:+ start:74 stop:817 length:744 start_codon:yes stop_codon:yes gene_type:complete